MDLGLEGKVALVTGASKGIGLGIAQALAREGTRVAMSSRSRDRIDAAARSVPGALGFVHNTADVAAAPRLVRSVQEELGPVEILVVSTEGPPAFADPLEPTIDDFRSAYESLMLGSVAIVQAALPGMTSRGWGRVVSVSSFVTRDPARNLVLSSSHRAALPATLKTYAHEVAQDGVTINSILPGRIATDRLVENLGSLETANEVARRDTPAARLGTVEELAAAATFLCSTPASYITGTTLIVDGGLSRAP
jgi:3-oxoacyl-[acyl-carrier protein] reductase